MTDYENRLELLARVASLYYDHGKNQQEIAEEIGITRSAISRLLTEAEKRGIVEHIVHYPWRTSPEIENALKSIFGLKHAIVLTRQNKSYEEMLTGLGTLAAQYFTSILPSMKLIGITWGTGLYQMVRAIRPQFRPDLEVIQLIGGTGSENGAAIGPLLAPNLANCLGCACRFLNAPLVMQNEIARDALLQDPAIRETLQRAEKCDIALVGLGSTRPEMYNPYKLGYITLAELEQMQADGIVGDVGGQHYNIHGEILDNHWINRKYVGISHATVNRMKMIMGVAGDAKKGDSIYGALRGKHIHVLVTDDSAARRVLELHKHYASG